MYFLFLFIIVIIIIIIKFISDTTVNLSHGVFHYRRKTSVRMGPQRTGTPFRSF